jgi:UDP-N-acetylglucosamine 2-epimerase (non-hydrolysing)
MQKTIHLVAGARPNFMKIAPVWRALSRESWCRPCIIHTGQHYDENMSSSFFRDLKLPDPDYYLGVGSGGHAIQTAETMIAYDKVCDERQPDWVVVVGDVNSTLAATLVATKRKLPVAHLEAGLRSGDRSMPEEINRLMTDSVADLLWTPSSDADQNLLSEGVSPERIVRVGNIMIDAFEMMRPQIEETDLDSICPYPPRGYGVVTLHRPSNVDSPAKLQQIVDSLVLTQKSLPLVFPVHPRTEVALKRSGLDQKLAKAGVQMLKPLGYIQFMALSSNARFVITDSGGVQEETSYLGIPCFTLRENTERPITVTEGTNHLVTAGELCEAVRTAQPMGLSPIQLWDGHTAARVVASLFMHVFAHNCP